MRDETGDVPAVEGFVALGSIDDPVATVQRRLGLRTTGVVDSRTLEALRTSGDTRLAGEDPERGLLPGQLVDSVTNEPLAGLIVRAFSLEDDQEGDRLAEDETNADGAFVLSLGEHSRVPALRLRVVDPSVGDLLTDDVGLPATGLILHVRRPGATLADAA